MDKSYDVLRYTVDEFDQNFCLKPPWSLLIVLLILSRDLLMPVLEAVSLISGGASTSGRDSSWLVAGQLPFWYLLEAPAFVLMYAWIRRTAGGNGATRWIWVHGRGLLLSSIAAQLAMMVFVNWTNGQSLASLPVETVSLMLLLVVVGVYVCSNPRLRDAFSDYPASAIEA